MTPHVWYVIAFILLTAATIAAASDKPHLNRWALPLLAAGLACYTVPAAFQLSS